jgi:hypothetical protein
MAELEAVEPTFGESIVDYSKDRRELTVLLAGEEYVVIKPKKADEWFVSLQMAIAGSSNIEMIKEMDRFLKKIIGDEVHAKLKERLLDDDDDVTWTAITQVMFDIFEVWTTEPDQPVRPTGRPSASSRGRKPTARR